MGDVEEASGDQLDQLSITVDQFNIEAQVPSRPSGPAEDAPMSVFKAGLFVTFMSIAGILNPPIPATTNKTHGILSQALHFLVCGSLAIGVLQMLLSTVLRRYPRMIMIAKLLTKIGWGLLSMELASGSALVVMVSPPPWFVLFLIFLFLLLLGLSSSSSSSSSSSMSY